MSLNLKIFLSSILIGALTVVGFQNCGPSHSSTQENKSSAITGKVIFSEDFDGEKEIVYVTSDRFQGEYGSLDFVGQFSTSPEAGVSGTKGARLNDAAIHPLVNLPITILPSKKYKLSLDLRVTSQAPAPGSSEIHNPYMEFMRPVNAVTFNGNPGGRLEITNQAWQRYEFLIDLAVGAPPTEQSIYFELSSAMSGANVLDVDNIVVEEIDRVATNIFPEGFFESHVDSLVLVPPLPVSALALTPEQASGWLSLEAGYGGEKGLRLDDTWFLIGGPHAPQLKANTRYRLSFYGRVINRKIETPDPGMSIAGRFLAVTSTEWELKTVEFMSGSEAAPLYAEFWIHQGSGNIVEISQLKCEELQ